eukprot:717184-Alexandrium_andersonii.AAC.1
MVDLANHYCKTQTSPTSSLSGRRTASASFQLGDPIFTDSPGWKSSTLSKCRAMLLLFGATAFARKMSYAT